MISLFSSSQWASLSMPAALLALRSVHLALSARSVTNNCWWRAASSCVVPRECQPNPKKKGRKEIIKKLIISDNLFRQVAVAMRTISNISKKKILFFKKLFESWKHRYFSREGAVFSLEHEPRYEYIFFFFKRLEVWKNSPLSREDTSCLLERDPWIRWDM